MKKILALLVAMGLALSPAFAQQLPPPAGYSILGGQTTLAATGTTARVALPATIAAYGAVTIYNPGTVDAFVALGGSTVTAAATGGCTIAGGPGPACLVKAGTTVTLWVGSGNTYIAGITGGTAVTLVIYQATGPIQLGRAGPSNGGTPGGAAGGDLAGTYPDPEVRLLTHVTNGAIPVAMSATSGALGGCTIGTDELCVTGQSTLTGRINAVEGIEVTGALTSGASGTGIGRSATNTLGIYAGGSLVASISGSLVQLNALPVSAGPVSVTAACPASSNCIGLNAANTVSIYANGTAQLAVSTTSVSTALQLQSTNAAGFRLSAAAGTSTLPNILPNKADTTDGYSGDGTSLYSIINSTPISTVTALGVVVRNTTVGSLGAATTVGARATVTDAAACVFGSTPTGGAAVVCPVIANGSAWVAG